MISFPDLSGMCLRS